MAPKEKPLTPASSVRQPLTEERLRSLLDADLECNRLVTQRENKISRAHYARAFGCTPGAMTRFVSVFAEYEQENKIVSGPMRHLSEMREWLTVRFESRTLDVRDGKVNRTPFMARFGLKGGNVVVRYPAIRALLNEFDARIEKDGYLPGDQQEAFERVCASLSCSPVLNTDRMTINQVALAESAGVPQTMFRNAPFADAISKRQAEIMVEVQASKIDPYVHGRVFAFSPLATHWPVTFLERIGVQYKKTAARWAPVSAKSPYQALVQALDWIATSKSPHCQAVVANVAEHGRVLVVDAWEEALFAYRDHLVNRIASGALSEPAVDTILTNLRSALEALSGGQVVPAQSVPLPGIKHSRRLRGHLRSVAEAGTPRADKNVDYVAFASERFDEACKLAGTDIGMGESKEFINGLAAEIGAARDLPADPALAVLQVLEHRLDALASHAKNIVTSAIEQYDRGRDLLSQARVDAAEFEAAYFADTANRFERNRIRRNLFPHPDDATSEQIEQGKANLLGLIEQRFCGIPPHAHEGPPYGQFFRRRYNEYGGLESTIGPMLNPAPEAVGAVLTLYLIESGANVAVGRTIDVDCIEASDRAEHHRITGHKAKAKGKPIVVDLPDTSSAVHAMEWLVSASSRLRARANEGDGDRLFLMRPAGGIQVMSQSWYTGWFKRFSAEAPGLEHVKLVPSMIRPSVLLKAALSHDGTLLTGLAIGQHSTTVSQGYQQKWATRLLYDQNIRRFQTAFESVVLASIDDAAAKLGVSPEAFNSRLGQLRATGLGTFCKDQRGRPEERGAICSKMDCWNDCPNLLIVAEVEAIAALLLWQGSLRSVQGDWERDRPERWDEVWLPWLCLADVVEEKMARGPLIKIWNAARNRANELSAQPGYVPPRPW